MNSHYRRRVYKC